MLKRQRGNTRRGGMMMTEQAARASPTVLAATSLFAAAMSDKAVRMRQRTEQAKERATPVIRSLVNFLQALAVLSTLQVAGSEEVRSVLSLAEVAGGAAPGLLPVQCATGMSLAQRLITSLLLPVVAVAAPFLIAVVATVVVWGCGVLRSCGGSGTRSGGGQDQRSSGPSFAGERLPSSSDRSITAGAAMTTTPPRLVLTSSRSSSSSNGGDDSPTDDSPLRQRQQQQQQPPALVAAGGSQPRKAPPQGFMQLLRRNFRVASFSVVAALFVIHFGTLRAIFRVFEVYPERIYGQLFLSADFETTTASEQYTGLMLPLAITGGIVYGLGIPALAVALLCRNSDRLTEPQTLARYGFLYKGLDVGRGDRRRRKQAAKKGNLASRTWQSRRGAGRSGLLSAAYLYEAVVLLRKTGLALIAAFSADPLGQGYLAALWLLLFLVTHLVVKPYADPLVNGLEAVSLTALTISQVANMYYEASSHAWLPWLVLGSNGVTVGAYAFALLAMSSAGARYAWLRIMITLRSICACVRRKKDTDDDKVEQADDKKEEEEEEEDDDDGEDEQEEEEEAKQPPPLPSGLASLASATAAGAGAGSRRPSMRVFDNPMRPQLGALHKRGKMRAARGSVAVKLDTTGRGMIRRE